MSERVVWVIEFYEEGRGWKAAGLREFDIEALAKSRAETLNSKLPFAPYRAWPYAAKESAQ